MNSKFPYTLSPKLKWLHLTGEVDKSVRFSCQILSGFNMPKITKIGFILDRVIQKLKGSVRLHFVMLVARVITVVFCDSS